MAFFEPRDELIGTNLLDEQEALFESGRDIIFQLDEAELDPQGRSFVL